MPGRPPWSPPPDRFLGRQPELRRLTEALSSGVPVTVLGPGGAGKTRIVRELLAAEAGAERLPEGGVVFVRLERVRDPEGLGLAVARALRVIETDPADDGALADALARRGACLLVLDNCEQLVEPVRALASVLLDEAPEACLLLTSRTRIGLPGEVLVEVGPLTDPEDAAELLLDRAARARPGFEPTDADRRAALAIAGLLDGIPLALELAAGRSGVLGLAPLAERMEQHGRIDLLSPEGAPGRHGALDASIAASWDLLDVPDRAALAGCSVFAGSFDAAAAEAVLGGGPRPVLDVLQRLLDRSLLRPTQRGGAVRFRLLGAVREFAARELEHAEQTASHEAACSSWYAAEADLRAAAVDGPEPGPALAWLRQERGQLTRVVREGQGDEPLRAAVALGALLVREGPLRDALDLVDVALAGVERPGPAPLLLRGRLLLLLGRPDAAGELVDALGADAQDPVPRGRSLLLAAEVSRARGRIREARDRAREAVEILPARGVDRAGALALLARLGWLRGRRAEALEQVAAAAAEARTAGAALLEATIAAWWGRAEAELGRAEPARELLRPAAARFEEVGDHRARADALRALGRCEQALGDVPAAAALFTEAVDLCRELGAASDEARARMDLAEVALAFQPHRADDLLRRALDAALRAGDAARTWRVRADLALLAWGEGRLAEAADQLGRASLVAERAADSRGRMETAALTGALAAVRGDTAAAEQAFARSDELLSGTTLAGLPARLVALWAFLPGDPPDDAAPLVEAHGLAPHDFGAVGRTGRVAEPRLARVLDLLRPRLSDQAWLAAWSRLLDPDARALLVRSAGAGFRAPGGDWVDLGEGSLLARLLDALVAARFAPVDALPPEALVEALWPGERMAFQSALDRVYQAVRRLRRAGLDPWLERVDEGYRLTSDPLRIP